MIFILLLFFSLSLNGDGTRAAYLAGLRSDTTRRRQERANTALERKINELREQVQALQLELQQQKKAAAEEGAHGQSAGAGAIEPTECEWMRALDIFQGVSNFRDAVSESNRLQQQTGADPRCVGTTIALTKLYSAEQGPMISWGSAADVEDVEKA